MSKSATITIKFSYFLGVYDVIVELCDTYGACSNVNLKAAITVLGKTFTEAELDQAAASITATLKTGKTSSKHDMINKRRPIFPLYPRKIDIYYKIICLNSSIKITSSKKGFRIVLLLRYLLGLKYK